MRRLIMSCIVVCSQQVDAQATSILSKHGLRPATTETEFAFPAGASGGVATSDTDEGDAGALLGVQVWQPGTWFTSVLFNFGGAREVEGPQAAFGAYMLDPGSGGRSLNFALSRMLRGDGVKRSGVGVFGRGGASFTTWTDPTPATPSDADINGMVIFGTAGAQILSRTIEYDDTNEYQFGTELGIALRALGGDLAQTDAARAELFGSDKTTFISPEITVFARLNSIQPFLRITFFGAENDVRAFTGAQGFLGVTVLSALFRGSQ
jgi:hypothetical protein